MKKLLGILLPIKMNACYIFTALTFIFVILSFMFNIPSLSIGIVIQLLILSFLYSILLRIIFSDLLLKSISYLKRCFVFMLPVLLLNGLGAITFKWFPFYTPTFWFAFFGISVLCFIGCMIGIEVYHQVEGENYTIKLNDYKKKKQS